MSDPAASVCVSSLMLCLCSRYDHPPEKFSSVFALAHEHGLGITIHAGEGDSAAAAANIIAVLFHAVSICEAASDLHTLRRLISAMLRASVV